MQFISKNNTNEDNQETTDLDTKETPAPPRHPVVHTSLPAVHAATAFPIKIGAKGNMVLRLQNALIASFGSGILKRYGADGQFGNELATALRSKGYSLPLSEADYYKIIGEKKAELKQEQNSEKNQGAKQEPIVPPIANFDPNAIAKNMFLSIQAKDFNASITLLKGIDNTTQYSQVSEQLKTYRINGVRQTLVNALLFTFTEKSQRINLQGQFLRIGLKFNGLQWKI